MRLLYGRVQAGDIVIAEIATPPRRYYMVCLVLCAEGGKPLGLCRGGRYDTGTDVAGVWGDAQEIYDIERLKWDLFNDQPTFTTLKAAGRWLVGYRIKGVRAGWIRRSRTINTGYTSVQGGGKCRYNQQ